MFLLALAVICVLFAAAVLIQRPDERVPQIVSGMLVSMAVTLVSVAMAANDAYLDFPHLIRVGDPFILLVPALIYLYVKEVTGSGVGRRDLFHFAPFVLSVILMIPFYLSSARYKVNYADGVYESFGVSSAGLLNLLVWLVVIGGYTIASIRQYEMWRRRLLQSTANPDRLGGWLLRMLRLLMWVLVLATLFSTVAAAGFIDVVTNMVLTHVLLAVTVFALAVHAIKGRGLPVPAAVSGQELQSEWPDPPLVQAPVEVFVWPEADPAGSGGLFDDDITLTDADGVFGPKPPQVPVVSEEERMQSRWHARLVAVMEEARPWQNPDLTASELADMVGLSENLLLRLINERERASFFEYVNRFRVAHVKRRLTTKEGWQLPLTVLAREAGYGSASALAEVFVKSTGISPKTFRRLAASGL